MNNPFICTCLCAAADLWFSSIKPESLGQTCCLCLPSEYVGGQFESDICHKHDKHFSLKKEVDLSPPTHPNKLAGCQRKKKFPNRVLKFESTASFQNVLLNESYFKKKSKEDNSK